MGSVFTLKDPLEDSEQILFMSKALQEATHLSPDDDIQVIYGANTSVAKVRMLDIPEEGAMVGQPSQALAKPLLMVTNLEYKFKMASPKSIIIGPVLGLILAVEKGNLQLGYATHYASAFDEVKGLVYCMSYDNIDLSKGLVTGYHIAGSPSEPKWVKGTYPLPSAIYRRVFLPDSKSKLAKAVPYGIVTHNYAYDKWRNHIQLMKSHILREHLPETKFVNDLNDIVKMLDESDSVYVKPTANDRGVGVIRIDKGSQIRVSFSTKDDGPKSVSFNNRDELLNYLKAKGVMKVPHIVQKSINLAKVNEDQLFDLRVMVQKTGQGNWACTGFMARVSAPKSVVNNAYMGGKMSDFEAVLAKAFKLESKAKTNLTNNIKRVCIEAARFIELGYGPQAEVGLDIGIDQDQSIWIIESNPLPPYHVNWHDKRVSREMVKNPLRYISYRAGFPI